MAAKTWFATSSLVSVHQEMSETDPGAEVYASPVTGWVVSTGATLHAAFDSQTEVAATVFVNNTPPDGSIDTTNGDCLRSANAYTGSFASANWNVHFACRANTNGGAQDGRMRCRLFRSANADGSSATEITAAQQQGGLVTNLATSATQVSTATFNPGAFSLTNEYVFVQLAWERTGAGGMSSADVNMRVGNTSGTGTRVITSDFTASYTLTCAQATFTETGQPVTLGVTMPCDQVTFTETGQPVTLGVTMPCAVGVYTETGQPVTLGVTMPCAVGAFALTGINVTLTYTQGSTYTVVLSMGAFTETGQPVTLGVTMPCAVGVYTETGQPVTFGVTMPCAVGTFAETGQAITLGVTMPCAVGLFAETGIAANLIGPNSGSHSLFCESGRYRMVGVWFGAHPFRSARSVGTFLFGSFPASPVGFDPLKTVWTIILQ